MTMHTDLQPAMSEPLMGDTSLRSLAHAQEAAAKSILDKKLIHGIAWTAGAKWISQVATWGITLVVARLLAPSDYGLVGMATLALGLVTLFSEFGLGTSIVMLRNLTDDQISQLNTLSVGLGLVGFAISLAVAAPIATFFRVPALVPVIIVTSIGLVISSFRTVPYSLLEKDMRFKLLGTIDGLQSGVHAIATLLLAYLGFGYWAIVLGNLSFVIALTGFSLICKRQRFAWPRFSGLREPLRFSWHLIVGRLSWFAYDNSDFAIAGRVLGEAQLGAYTMAWTLAHVPLVKLTELVNRVTPSFFSSIQTDLPGLRRYLQNITQGLALVIYPATIGIALVANEFVTVALGVKWYGMVIPLELLALHALIRSNVIVLTPVLNAIGETRLAMWQQLASLLVLPASFYVGSRWGTTGISAVWVLVYPLMQIPLYWRLFRRIQMPVREYFGAVWPATSGCMVMVVAVEALKRFLDPAHPIYIRLATEVLAGAFVYVLVLASMHRECVRGVIQLTRMLRTRSA
jgi:teichuronic acid exporter